MRIPSVLALALLISCGTTGPGANPQISTADDQTAAQKFKSPVKTAFVIVLENQNWSDVKGNASAPYINQTLLSLGAHAEHYLNVPGIHPSEPNYLWMEAGTNFGVLNDNPPSSNHQATTKHLTRLLQNAGIGWKSYQENITGKTCPLANSGLYAAKHNPMVFFDDITNSRSASSANCIAHIRPYTELQADLTNGTVSPYVFITPNLCNDGHNSTGCQSSDSLANADGWLASNIPAIMASQAYQNGGAIFITWDESEGGDFPIGMIVLSPLVHGGYTNSIKYSHSSLLRTLQEIFNVTPLLGDAAKATDLYDLFSGTAPAPPTGDLSPPVCAISAPTNGATLAVGSATVTAQASDNVSVTRIEFDLDGSALTAGTASSATWNATAGSHTLACKAFDAAGNVGVSATVTVTVASSGGGTTGGGSTTRLRIMEGNISSGNNQDYTNGEGGRIFHGLNPDVVTIQEFNFGDDSATAIRSFVDSNFGAEFSYYRESVSGGGTIPNGIISRYPILQSGSWSDPNVANRGFAYAEIDIPGSTNLWVVSTHMLTSSAANRNAEAGTIVADIQAHVPPNDYVVLGGDFNTGSRTEACMSAYSAEFTVTGPFPDDGHGNANTSEGRSKPHDWIISNPSLTAKQIPVVVGTDTFANGLVVDTQIYTPLSDIAPAKLTDSHATGEQHMAVVKDYAL